MSVRPVAALVALLALVVSTFAVAPAMAVPDAGLKVLMISSSQDSYAADVRTKLEGSGAFAELSAPVHLNQCGPSTPTAAELEGYDAVYLWSDCGFEDPDAMGDVLADYVDGGGRLVVGVFANTTGYGVAGRLESGGYLPTTRGPQVATPASLVADLPAHPLLAGVSSFHGGASSYRASGLSLAPGATLVASWSTGEPLVSVRHNVVSLNFFPPSSDARSDFWNASTDGLALMVNALGVSLDAAPSFTTAASASFAAGTAGSFTISAGGRPAAAISATGTVPSGLTFTDNGNGTATLAGTPAAGTGGSYALELSAANGIEPDATQTLDLTVNEAPAVSSLPTAAFTVGTAGSFTVTTTAGHPAATTLTETGDLPDGVTFTDNGDGTATVSGTPASGSAGSYPLTLKAANTALSSTQELTLTVALETQAVAITSTPPTSAVVGQTYAVTATGGASENPVAVSIDPSSAAVCAIDGTTVTFQHPGSCVISADQAGDGRYAAGTATQTVAVTAAATTTDVKVGADHLTATVVPTAPGAGTPTGTVTFFVEGAEVGTATLAGGTATLPFTVESGKSRAVAATYSGDADFTGSSASTARHDPSITAKVTSARAKSAHGWYRTPVIVTFQCKATGGALSAPCPKPVTLKADRAGQSVTRTILAADGGAATVTVRGINIDRTAPRVSLKGVRHGATYPGQAPKARCVGKDGLSGIARCAVSKRVSGESVTVTAKATDRAGNTRTSTVRYRVARFYVAGAPFRGGAYQVRDGRTYTVVALTSGTARPQYFNAAPRGARPTASGSYLQRSGKQSGLHRHVIAVRMDRGMSRRGAWDLGVKSGSTLHRIAVNARR